jgi:gluconolactonase
VAVRSSDGSVWFSDPDFGIMSDYEGHRAESEIGTRNVYRVDPVTARVTLVADGFDGPNGLVFSPDETRLYVSDSRESHIRVFSVHEDGTTLSEGEIFAECHDDRPGAGFDNIRFDDTGHLWVGALAGGVHCYHPDGTLLGRVNVPEPVANVTFGGPKNNVLFITATTSLYAAMLSVTGAPRVSP